MIYMKKILLIPVSIIFFYACSEHCEQFPKKYKDYTPYEKDDVLCFENTKGDNIVFEVSEKSFYDPPKIPWGCKCVCGSHLLFKISSQTNIDIYINSFYTENEWNISCQVCDITEGISFYRDGTNPLSDTLLLSPSKDSKIKGTIKLVKGVGLVNLFIDDEEYTLKKE